MRKKALLFFAVIFFFGFAGRVFAHQPEIIFSQKGDIQINSPEISRAFYDELRGQPKIYVINSDTDFDLYVNLLVPAFSNPTGKYSAKIEGVLLDGENFQWQEFYEPFGRDYYFKGPEFDQKVPAGQYKIEIFSKDNNGKYVLAVGKEEKFGIKSILNIYWQLPYLKLVFFKTPVYEFLLTPFGLALIGLIFGIIILFTLFDYFFVFSKEEGLRRRMRTLILTSNGMACKNAILTMLKKPLNKILVGYVITASKLEEDKSFVEKDRQIMEELGFTVEDVDLEIMSYGKIMHILKTRDIMYVQDGNLEFLLKQMKVKNFEKIVKKLLKREVIYVGAGAGSVVAGSINLVSKKIAEQFASLNDGQALIVQGKNVVLFDNKVTPELAEKPETLAERR